MNVIFKGIYCRIKVSGLSQKATTEKRPMTAPSMV